jgi:hypothetical protein
MSFESNYPGAANLIGNVTILRNVHPTIRASLRRTDPDFSSSSPYYPSAAGKTLRLNYTVEVSTVVTPTTIDIVLSGSSVAAVIATINAADASNIQALDFDGFLAIQNLNPGKTHYLTIAPFSTSADDASPILGFAVDPFPGSTSFAGEIASAPGTRSQLNPQTTTLLTRDDGLGSGELNRGFASILQMLENLRAELSRDVIVYKDVRLFFSAHNPGPVPAARINDDSIRLFYPQIDSGDDPPLGLSPKVFAPYYRALDNTGSSEDVVNFGVGTTNSNALLVTNLFYATNLTDFNTSAPFATWGTPDGGSIVASTTANKNKHPSTTVTSIKGNIVQCSSATFVTHKVKAGDPVKLTASILQPFDHSGWFAIDAVIDETHLAVRPMASTEEIPDGTSVRPRWLNPAAGGTLRVAVGRFIPAGDIYVTINSATTSADHVIRIPAGVPFISTLNEDRARDLSGNLGRLGAVLQDHLGAFPDRHLAASITGFTSATSWRDGTTIAGADLKLTIEDILTDLKAQATGNSGTGRIGAEVISIGGGTPNTLAQGTILTQLTALITALRDHVNQASSAHAASAISYAGGGNWADGTTNPAATVEAQFDKIFTDLGGSGGAAKVGFAGSGTWADGTTNPATTIEAQLDKIVTDLGGTGGASKIKYDGGSNWADGTTNPATTVETQLDKILTDLGGAGGAAKIQYNGGGNWADGTTNPAATVEAQLDKTISDLAPSTGTAKIGGAATGSDIAAGTLAAQIADLAVNWLKMARANVIAAAQTFTSVITANGGLTTSSGVTLTGSAEEHYPIREYSIDCSAFQNDFGGFLNDGSQGFLQRTAFDGSNAILLQSFKVGAGNSSGQTALVCSLDRTRVGDKILSIEVCLAQAGTPNGSEFFTLQDNGPSSTAENVVFTSGSLARPGSGLITSGVAPAVNYTHVTGSALRLRIQTSSSSGGTMYLRWVIIKYQRP